MNIYVRFRSLILWEFIKKIQRKLLQSRRCARCLNLPFQLFSIHIYQHDGANFKLQLRYLLDSVHAFPLSFLISLKISCVKFVLKYTYVQNFREKYILNTDIQIKKVTETKKKYVFLYLSNKVAY